MHLLCSHLVARCRILFLISRQPAAEPVQSRGSFDKLGFNGAPASNEPSTLNENSEKPLSLECASRRHSRKVKTEKLCIYGIEGGGKKRGKTKGRKFLLANHHPLFPSFLRLVSRFGPRSCNARTCRSTIFHALCSKTAT